MAPRSKASVRPSQNERAERPQGQSASNPYGAAQEVPLPEVIEKDTDSVWAMWNEAMEDKAAKDADTIPATLLMGLPEFPKEPDAD